LQENRLWVRKWVKPKAGAVRLVIEKGRWAGAARMHRICKMCKSGEVKDIEHGLDGCDKWDKERLESWRQVGLDDEKLEKRSRGWSGAERME
jgi:hypothetical protein